MSDRAVSVAEVCKAHIDETCTACDENNDDLWIHPRDLGACRECGNRYARDDSFYDDESLCPGCGDQQADLGDYPPMPRNYVQCDTCGGDMTIQHHCNLMQAFRRILEETRWVEKRQLKAHRASMERIRAIAAAVSGEAEEK